MQFLIGIILLIIITILLFVILAGVFFILDLFFELPYISTKKEKLEIIEKLAQIKKGETAVDLGSGDGRLLFLAAKHGAKAVGYEVNPVLTAITRLKIKLKGLTNLVSVQKQSFWQADLKVADVIFVYAFRKTMKKFEDYIYKNAKKGTRVIVNTNPFPNKKAIKSANQVFLYIV